VETGVDRDRRALLGVTHQGGRAESFVGRCEDAHHAVAGGFHHAAAGEPGLGVEQSQALGGEPVCRLITVGLVQLRAAVDIREKDREIVAALGCLVRRFVVHGPIVHGRVFIASGSARLTAARCTSIYQIRKPLWTFFATIPSFNPWFQALVSSPRRLPAAALQPQVDLIETVMPPEGLAINDD
jgi:hypothetical protein